MPRCWRSCLTLFSSKPISTRGPKQPLQGFLVAQPPSSSAVDAHNPAAPTHVDPFLESLSQQHGSDFYALSQGTQRRRLALSQREAGDGAAVGTIEEVPLGRAGSIDLVATSSAGPAILSGNVRAAGGTGVQLVPSLQQR